MTAENIKHVFEGAKKKGADAIHAVQDPDFPGRVSNLFISSYSTSKRAIESLIYDGEEPENPLAPNQPVSSETREATQSEAPVLFESEVRHSKIYSPLAQLRNDDLFEEVDDEDEEIEAGIQAGYSIRETKDRF